MEKKTSIFVILIVISLLLGVDIGLYMADVSISRTQKRLREINETQYVPIIGDTLDFTNYRDTTIYIDMIWTQD